MNSETKLDPEPSDGLPRRAVIRGAAWTVPVIAVAVTIPLVAASSSGQDG
ncbi:hypothetical protein SRABI76_02413 [Microbacterium oxydans]|uniref:Uncharacterized protein n=1 Tax=Microbacterium oxydans TaxID=82380 RepID=A0A0F0LB12_9MICO|nr:hypothetical protein [Microbacterium oxydans]KJL30313.1 hypothetical protein RS83_01063 [Microbacterium oxydans]CAH0217079.1 hypothetical protein SRABI76_02413 [Microbacterium oxydans]